MARADSMATIDAALSGGINSTSSQAPSSAGNLETALSPFPETELPELTANQKRAFDAARQVESDRHKLEREYQSDIERQAEIDTQQQEEQQTQTERLAKGIANSVTSIGRGTAVTLEGIPTPGDLVTPLLVLLVFFFLLLPVNGHTRLVWLWLVLSGNASIGAPVSQNVNASGSNAQGAGGQFSGGPATSGGSNPSATDSGVASGVASVLIPGLSPAFLGGLMTGVEDFLI